MKTYEGFFGLFKKKKLPADESLVKNMMQDKLSELKDDGFMVDFHYILKDRKHSQTLASIYKNADRNNPLYTIGRATDNNKFYWKDVKDTFSFIVDYFKDHDVSFEICFKAKNSYDNNLDNMKSYTWDKVIRTIKDDDMLVYIELIAILP